MLLPLLPFYSATSGKGRVRGVLRVAATSYTRALRCRQAGRLQLASARYPLLRADRGRERRGAARRGAADARPARLGNMGCNEKDEGRGLKERSDATEEFTRYQL